MQEAKGSAKPTAQASPNVNLLARALRMQADDLRIALFSGNYNYTRDGCNQALNRLADYILRQGAALRVYAPVVPDPDFAPTGDLVDVPNMRMPVPGRGEYRLTLGLGGDAKADLARFAPNTVHLSAPDPTGHAALKWAESQGLPVLASVHTRFETYPRYYGLGFMEPVIEGLLRRFYRRCDALVAPSPSQIAELRAQGMHEDIGLWSRGVDRARFGPEKRDMAWRERIGLADGDVAVVFLGRLVMEKGLDVFAAAVHALEAMGTPHKVLIIGDGPAREWFEKEVPQAIFAGFQTGADLARALASGDVFFNPSITETFGNVTLEAMASGLPVVAAGATGAASLVREGETGTLVPPASGPEFARACAEALAPYCRDAGLRRVHGAAGEAASRAYDWDGINQAVIDTYLRLHRTRAERRG